MNVTSAWQRYLDLASGVTQVTQQRAESAIKALIRQGEVAADRMEAAVDELLKRSERNRKAMANLVKAETERAVDRLGLARQRDVERLQARIARLEAQRAEPAAKKAAGKATKKSPGAKKAAASAAGKQAARKATAKKAAGRRAPASPPPTPESPNA